MHLQQRLVRTGGMASSSQSSEAQQRASALPGSEEGRMVPLWGPGRSSWQHTVSLLGPLRPRLGPGTKHSTMINTKNFL
jgi:hypothetical protein